MSHGSPARRSARGGLGLALLLGALVSLTATVALGHHSVTVYAGLTPLPRVDAVVVLVITLAGALLAAWFACHLALGAACVLVAAAGRRWRAGERFVAQRGPTLVRRAVATGLGVSIGLGGLAATAHEPAPDLGWQPTTGQPDAVLVSDAPLDLGWVPTEPAPNSGSDHEDAHDGASHVSPDAPSPDRNHTPDDHQDAPDRRGAERGARLGMDVVPSDAAPEDEPEQRHVVVPGESLWSITRSHLGDVDDDAVAAAWPVLYDTNRDVVGPNPDLIHPGQELTVPAFHEEQP